MRHLQLRACGHPATSGQGFSLVEILVATALLATVLAALAQLFAVATRANVDARDTTYATVLASQKLEELRAAPFPEALVDESVEYIDARGNRLDGSASATRPAYTRRWSVEPLSADAVNTIVIRVVVSRYRRRDAIAIDAAARLPDGARLVTLRTRKAQ